MNCLFVVISLSMAVALSYHAAALVISIRLASDQLFQSASAEAALINRATYFSSGVRSTMIEKWLSEDYKLFEKLEFKKNCSEGSGKCDPSMRWVSGRNQNELSLHHG